MAVECEKKEAPKILDSEAPPKLVKPNYMLMSLQRIAVIALIISVVVFVVYVTPMPEEYFENCDRECHELDWPMICRVKLTVEVYKTLSRPCGSCGELGSSAACSVAGCISADGRERGVLVANRALPAPNIHVCHNDILVVDLVNRAPAHALSMHWRGQSQRETPFMDGAPMVTQCPAPSYTTFQYKFRASGVGTHMYHAHSGAEAADGLAGLLVVRQSPRVDPLKHLYDEDRSEHAMLISEWGKALGGSAALNLHTPKAESLLINGRGRTDQTPNAPMSIFKVKPGKRYRFRVAYAGGARSCPITLSVERHNLQLIALDGHPVVPKMVRSVELAKGERADLVLLTDQPIGSYEMRVKASKGCQGDLEGSAVVQYGKTEVKTEIENRDKESSGVIEEFSSVRTEDCGGGETAALCLSDVESTEVMPEELAGETVDVQLIVPFNFTTRQTTAKRLESWGLTDGFRFTYPASPLLTQAGDVPSATLCREADAGAECVHVKTLPLGATVEIVLFDQGGESDHVFHVHGYSFHVVGVRELSSSLDKRTVARMRAEGTLFPKQNLRNPPSKDTVTVPRLGAVAIRFKATNPGYWLVREERAPHWTRGLDFVLKVGEDGDFVRPPGDFPRCGSYVGPEYFLI